MYSTDPMGAALDRYITGNWGEDSNMDGVNVPFSPAYEDCCEGCPSCHGICEGDGEVILASFECDDWKECDYYKDALEFARAEEETWNQMDEFVDRIAEGW